MSKQKKEALEQAKRLQNDAVIKQFHKTKKRVHRMQPQQDSGQAKTATGQPRPITTSFGQLRERALLTPMLNADIDALNPDVVMDRHTKVIDYNRNYFMGVSVLCALHERHYFWYVQTIFVSKASGKNVLLNLLTPKNIKALKEGFKWAIGSHGQKNVKEEIVKDGFVYWVPFTRAEYDLLLEPFRDLTYLVDEHLGDTKPFFICEHCQKHCLYLPVAEGDKFFSTCPHCNQKTEVNEPEAPPHPLDVLREQVEEMGLEIDEESFGKLKEHLETPIEAQQLKVCSQCGFTQMAESYFQTCPNDGNLLKEM